MAVYRADDPESIVEIFEREGDALQKAGFRGPDLSEAPEEYICRPGVDELHRIQERAYLEGDEATLALAGLELDRIVK